MSKLAPQFKSISVLLGQTEIDRSRVRRKVPERASLTKSNDHNVFSNTAFKMPKRA